MIKEKEILMFQKLRKKLYDAIEKSISEDPHHKSYEGAFEIGIRFKNIFETIDRDCILTYPDEWVIRLDCYVIGPRRHYEWVADSFVEVFTLCEVDIARWISEAQ